MVAPIACHRYRDELIDDERPEDDRDDVAPHRRVLAVERVER